jgi:hypothetical protein
METSVETVLLASSEIPADARQSLRVLHRYSTTVTCTEGREEEEVNRVVTAWLAEAVAEAVAEAKAAWMSLAMSEALAVSAAREELVDTAVTAAPVETGEEAGVEFN